MSRKNYLGQYMLKWLVGKLAERFSAITLLEQAFADRLARTPVSQRPAEVLRLELALRGRVLALVAQSYDWSDLARWVEGKRVLLLGDSLPWLETMEQLLHQRGHAHIRRVHLPSPFASPSIQLYPPDAHYDTALLSPALFSQHYGEQLLAWLTQQRVATRFVLRLPCHVPDLYHHLRMSVAATPTEEPLFSRSALEQSFSSGYHIRELAEIQPLREWHALLEAKTAAEPVPTP